MYYLRAILPAKVLMRVRVQEVVASIDGTVGRFGIYYSSHVDHLPAQWRNKA
jgi:hypothetical protein